MYNLPDSDINSEVEDDKNCKYFVSYYVKEYFFDALVEYNLDIILLRQKATHLFAPSRTCVYQLQHSYCIPWYII